MMIQSIKLKKLIWIFCLVYPMLFQAQEQVDLLIISKKVGHIIDKEEKIRFGLFPEYGDSFKGAQFFQKTDKTIQLVIYLEDGTSIKKVVTDAEYIDFKLLINRKQINYSKLDSTSTTIVRLIDETALSGIIQSIGEEEIILNTLYLGKISIPKSKISDIQQFQSAVLKQGTYWFPNPHDTRHFFAPTARSLKKGEGYFQDIYVMFITGNYGITDNFLIGGGLSIIPGIGFENQVFFINPKAGFEVIKDVHLGGGFILASMPESDENRQSAGILYGVGTYGTRENNITLGVGYGAFDGKFQNYPIMMIGGMYRIARRISLVTENWLLFIDYEDYNQYTGMPEPVEDDPLAVFSYGMRFFGEKLCVDLGFINIAGEAGPQEFFFPGIPYLDFVVKF